MNILIITNHLNVGGIASYVLTLASGMKERGHQVYVAAAEGQMWRDFENQGFRMLRLPIMTKQEVHPKILLSALKASGYVRRYKIDVIHTQTRTTHVLGWLIQRLTGVVHITTCHGFYTPKIFRRIFPCRGDRTIAISDPVSEHLRCDLCALPEKIVVIYNGIDVERYIDCGKRDRGECRHKLACAEGPLIGVIARLADVKGHKHLIEAMQDVVKAYPDSRLIIVGEGKMKQDLERWTSNLNLSRQVVFLPSVSDTRDILCALDIFVLPSLSEGLGIALMEAMAAGCAVIGSSVGGIKSLIQHEYNGLLVPPADAGALAAAVKRLLADSSERRAFGEAAQQTAVQRFSRELMISQTEEVYRLCLGGKKQR